MKLKFIIYLLFVCFLAACECIPEINTPKIISPNDYSKAVIINAIPDKNILEIESNDIPLLHSAEYENENPEYQKINAGSSYIRLIDKNTNTSLIMIPVQLEKFSNYTIIFYGFRNSAKALVLQDSIKKNSSAENAFVRFVHTSFDSGEFIFKLSGNKSDSSSALSFKTFSEIMPFKPGIYKFEIINPVNQNVILSRNNLQISGSNLYNIILKGTSFTMPEKPLVVDIVPLAVSQE